MSSLPRRLSQLSSSVALDEVYSEQFEKVQTILLEQNAFSKDVIEKATRDYYNNLGLNEYYFQTSTPASIADHVHCIIAANLLHKSSREDFFPLIHQRRGNDVVVISRASLNNREASSNYAVEKMLETEYLHLDGSAPSWRLQGYRSVGSVFDDPAKPEQRIRTCFLQVPQYSSTEPVDPNETELSKLFDQEFWKHKEGTATSRIFKYLNGAVVNDHTGLGLQVHKEPREDNVYRLDFAFRCTFGRAGFYSSLGDIITAYGIFSKQKHVEPLANGVVIFTCFVQMTNEALPIISDMTFEQRIDEVLNAALMRHVLPNTRYNSMCFDRTLFTLEAAYCHAASRFTAQFSQSVGPAFSKIARVLENSKEVSNQDLYEVRTRLKQTVFTEDKIFHTVQEFPQIAKRLYAEFRNNHCPSCKPMPNVYQSDNELVAEIRRLDDYEAPSIFEWFLKFNRCVLKTNFFKSRLLSLAFRCEPSFLPDSDFEHKPFGIMFLTGNGFKGFHSRFADVARGGIRVVQSRSPQQYHLNSARAFDEVYKLSRTQNFKNKDIPEGGSKGVILLDMTSGADQAAELTRSSFYRYIDSFLDLLLPSEEIVDRYGKLEVCFLGPDEFTGTGKLMDWASRHARVRGAWFWKAFTTGKDSSMGGIPHDVYAMTTTSVETFVRGALAKMGMEECVTTKCQTGGPDGDLGSNSILMSKTKLTSLVDGAGVLVDPNGLDRQELLSLVQRRTAGLPTSSMHYDQKKLSPQGFKVSTSARDVTLPDGTVVANGLEFRNSFHLNPLSSAFLFNPNGGRPESVTPFNCDALFYSDGSPRFKLIVEGANVFITDDARIALEKRGVVLFKDASTNKGGVTSSSCEVLAALVMNDEEFEERMCVKDPTNPPLFYKKYVEEVQQKICENATMEFEVLWREKEMTGIPRCTLTDMISGKIIKLKTEILESKTLLWEDELLRSVVLHRAVPKVLMPGTVDLKTLLQRVPEPYLKALFASYLASRFYYTYGMTFSTFAFMEFIQSFKLKRADSEGGVVRTVSTAAMSP